MNKQEIRLKHIKWWHQVPLRDGTVTPGQIPIHTMESEYLFDKIDLPVENTVVLICGPSVMIHFALIELKKKGFKDEQIFASLERMMQCGVGYCSHCNIGNKYTCIDGPVFNAADLKQMPVKED